MSGLPVAFEFVTATAAVQARGTVAGRPFFFRALPNAWSFAVAEAPHVDPVQLDAEAEPGHGWFRSGAVPARGGRTLLSPGEATALIHACAAAYLRDREG